MAGVCTTSPSTTHNRCMRRKGALMNRRRAVGAGLGCLLMGVSPAGAAGGNPSVITALKEREVKMVKGGGGVLSRLIAAEAQVGIVVRYAEEGEYSLAREQLRVGPLSKLRTSMKDASDLLVFERPNFESWERSAVLGPLDALDNALRELGRGEGKVSNVSSDASMLISGIEAVQDDLRRKLGV